MNKKIKDILKIIVSIFIGFIIAIVLIVKSPSLYYNLSTILNGTNTTNNIEEAKSILEENVRALEEVKDSRVSSKEISAKEIYEGITKILDDVKLNKNEEVSNEWGLSKNNVWRMTLKSLEQYTKLRNFTIVEDGINKAYYSISNDGNIMSLIAYKGLGSIALMDAVKNGGKKADSYDGNNIFFLINKFRPISWCEGIREYEKDIPDDMDTEDIIAYVYDENYEPTKDWLDINKNYHGELIKANKEIKFCDDYDECLEYRDNYLK